MKKSIAVLTSLIIVSGLMTGCGIADYVNKKVEEQATEEVLNDEVDNQTYLEDIEADELENDDLDEISIADTESDVDISDDSPGVIEGASYMMIYNPGIYDMDNKDHSLASMKNIGSIGNQIIVGDNRADGLDDIEMPVSMAQGNRILEDAEINAGGRAGGIDPVYSVGDTHEFYAYDTTHMVSRSLYEFKCIYEGEHCYIWDKDGSVDINDAQKLGEVFDTVIYDKDVNEFGKARFTENGGKINMLFQPLKDGMGGYFIGMDLIATGELSESQIEGYKINTDHAIININSDFIKENFEFVESTLAHEFQHLICATDSLEKGTDNVISLWLNESMSAYAEEMIFPGRKNNLDYDIALYISDFCRKGQSLYNFNYETDPYIGAYGAVYLFEDYIHEKSGNNVYSNVHSGWRESGDVIPDTSKLLYDSVSDEFRNEINDKYTYPSGFSTLFKSQTEEWMSKLTLDFYLDSMNSSAVDPAKMDLCHLAMLYTSGDSLDIEGGGRVVVALSDGTFTTPDDADKGLVYVGLDENFKPVSDPVYR